MASFTQHNACKSQACCFSFLLLCSILLYTILLCHYFYFNWKWRRAGARICSVCYLTWKDYMVLKIQHIKSVFCCVRFYCHPQKIVSYLGRGLCPIVFSVLQKYLTECVLYCWNSKADWANAETLSKFLLQIINEIKNKASYFLQRLNKIFLIPHDIAG